jgi:transposase
VDQHFCNPDQHASRACLSRLPGKRARPVLRGRRRGNAPPLPDWRIWYYVLEAHGLAVQLVNSSQARQLAGRPKTDDLDAQWLARLTEMGLLRPSFVPPPQIRQLRDWTRMRVHLVHDRTRQYQWLEKLLEGALVKLTSVTSLRTASARAMIRAMIAGQRDPQQLAALAQTRLKAKHDELVQALDGAMFGGHHACLAAMLLNLIGYLDEEIEMLDGKIAACLDQIPQARGVDADGSPGAGAAPDAAVLPAVQRLAEIPGVSEDLARAIIGETGLDMTRFPTAAHLVSWAGLAPVARQSGPRSRKPKKGQGDSYLRGFCTQAANGAARTDTFLGERHRRVAKKRGPGRAKVAVARSILSRVGPPVLLRAVPPQNRTCQLSRHPAQASHLGRCGLQRWCCAPALPGPAGAVAGGVHQDCGRSRVPPAVPPRPPWPAGCGLDVLAGDARPPVLPFLRGGGQAAGVEQPVSAQRAVPFLPGEQG